MTFASFLTRYSQSLINEKFTVGVVGMLGSEVPECISARVRVTAETRVGYLAWKLKL